MYTERCLCVCYRWNFDCEFSASHRMRQFMLGIFDFLCFFFFRTIVDDDEYDADVDDDVTDDGDMVNEHCAPPNMCTYFVFTHSACIAANTGGFQSNCWKAKYNAHNKADHVSRFDSLMWQLRFALLLCCGVYCWCGAKEHQHQIAASCQMMMPLFGWDGRRSDGKMHSFSLSFMDSKQVLPIAWFEWNADIAKVFRMRFFFASSLLRLLCSQHLVDGMYSYYDGSRYCHWSHTASHTRTYNHHKNVIITMIFLFYVNYACTI